jgi:predicted GNAT family acetyltransferase
VEALDIRHDSSAHRFAVVVEGFDAFVDYTREGNVLAINHTLVPPEIGGRGVAAQLMQATLEFARTEGLKVDPRCSYAEAYLRRHPQYADLTG